MNRHLFKHLLFPCGVLLFMCMSAYGSHWVEAIKGATISSVERTFDGGYVAIGTKDVNDSRDVLLVRLNSAGELQWAKTYGESGNQSGTTILRTVDGGFLFTGGGSGKSFLVKIDTAGKILWQKTYSKWGNRLIQAADGGLFLVDTGGYMKLNSDGAILWQQKFYGLRGAMSAAVATSDGGFVFAGSWGNLPMAAKIGPTGNIVWQKVYKLAVYVYPDAEHHDRTATTINTTADGGYVVGGMDHQSWGCAFGWGCVYGHRVGWVVKLDPKGNPSWQSILEDVRDLTSLRQEKDGHILIMGETWVTTPWFSWPFIWSGRLDSTGNVIWQKTFGETPDSETTAESSVSAIHDTRNDGTVFVGDRWDSQQRYAGLIGRTSQAGNVCSEFRGPDSHVTSEAVSITTKPAHLEIRSGKSVQNTGHWVSAPVKLNIQNICDTSSK